MEGSFCSNEVIKSFFFVMQQKRLQIEVNLCGAEH